MFLLIPDVRYTQGEEPTLHSTMFLLILNLRSPPNGLKFPLHSTMFLLIPQSAYMPFIAKHLYIPLCFY